MFLRLFAIPTLLLVLFVSAFAQESREVWVARHNGPGNGKASAGGLAVDRWPDGSTRAVYVTGFSAGAGGDSDYATVKYSPEGKELWVAGYNGPGNSTDSASGLAIDRGPDGSARAVYVTGTSRGVETERDYATVKYSPEGEELWVARYDGPGNGFDSTGFIVVDSTGAVYVTGFSSRAGRSGDWDYATVKYSPEGAEVWVLRYNNSGPEGRNVPKGLAIDSDGAVYVTGNSWGTDRTYDYATVKYSPEGRQIWVARYDSPRNGNDSARGLAVDNTGAVYVIGYDWSNPKGPPGAGADYTTVKFSPEGKQLWVARYNGPGKPGSDWDQPVDVVVDSAGAIYVTGYSASAGGDWDYATVKYCPDFGEELWVARYNGPGNRNDSPRELVLDSAGAVYVTGDSVGAEGNGDYATVKYSPEGEELSVARYNGTGDGNDSARHVAVDSADGVYVTGNSWGTQGEFDWATVKYGAPGKPLVQFLRGDCNVDGQVEGQVTDAVFLLQYNFLGGERPPCLAACDVNGDGRVEGQVTDAVSLLTHNFLAGPPPVEPFPDCGVALLETDETLGCETPPESCR